METKLKIKQIEKRLSLMTYQNFALFLLLLGGFFNVHVMIGNDNKMPVLTDDVHGSEQHIAFDNFDQVNYPYLADIFNIKISRLKLHFSIGDVLYTSGALLFIIVAINETRIKLWH